MKNKKIPKIKPAFIERMKVLLPEEKDFQNYLFILEKKPVKSFRCNTLKISPEELKKRLEKKGWKIIVPWKKYPEIMIVENELEPGEFGRSFEHLLGYYYIQELASMLPILVLEPKEGESFLDLCAAPGSKTTQAASMMKNSGIIFANEVSLGRLRILASNLERCGVTNSLITKKDGIVLGSKFKKAGIFLDKILVDAPCSGEGTLRSSYSTYLMWNEKTIARLSRIQKRLVESAIGILKPGGEMVYSTCTHAPEENEEIVNWILENFPEMNLEDIDLPLKTRPGLIKWKNKKFSEELRKCVRIYPQDNNTEGFFIAKFWKNGE